MTHTWEEDLEWYKTHTDTKQIGFNPDGMCLKLCRTSRGIEAKYRTAKEAQDATPKEHRFTKVRDLRRGMKLFFDDPNDSNTAGHIVTMVGRLKGHPVDQLDGILVATNSVVSGKIVVVRASYFGQYWGDSFQFGTDYLNGVEFDYFSKPVPPQRDESSVVRNFLKTAPVWDLSIIDDAVQTGRKDLAKNVRQIESAVEELERLEKDNKKPTRVKKFVKGFTTSRVLEMDLLNDAVDDGRIGAVRQQRNQINSAIKQILWV